MKRKNCLNENISGQYGMQDEKITFREDERMKKVIIVLGALLTLLFTGAFVCMNQKSEEVKTVTAEQVLTNQFTDQVPFVSPDQMVGFPTY
jgi:hypothetical protein